jgi:hypothetical protein
MAIITDNESRSIPNGITRTPGTLIQCQLGLAVPISGSKLQQRIIVIPMKIAGVQSLSFSLNLPTTGTSSAPPRGITRMR